jgi:hypothetical protein
MPEVSGEKWRKMAKNGEKWQKMPKTAKNGEKRRKLGCFFCKCNVLSTLHFHRVTL